MARKLRTFQTSIGFYDLAVAAPSMKAALEAWGAGSNLFHQGLAKETDDPAVVDATIAKPGVVLKRPVGSNGRFGEHADLPELAEAKTEPRGQSRARGRQKPTPDLESKARPHRKTDDKAAREAAQKFERDQKRREAERKREEAARAKERERRDKAVAKAQGELDRARRDHEAKAGAIEADRAAVERRSENEQARWDKQEAKLRAALRKAQR